MFSLMLINNVNLPLILGFIREVVMFINYERLCLLCFYVQN